MYMIELIYDPKAGRCFMQKRIDRELEQRFVVTVLYALFLYVDVSKTAMYVTPERNTIEFVVNLLRSIEELQINKENR